MMVFVNISHAHKKAQKNLGVSCKKHYYAASSVKGLTLEVTEYYNCDTGKLQIKEVIYHYK